MDPFSAEGELINIHNAFHQGQYQSVIDFNTSSFSPENALPARILKLRAQVALGNTDDVLADIEGETEESPSLSAVKALAQFAAGNAEAATQLAQDLAENYPDDATVQVLGGTVLQNVGKSEEALALLGKHQGNLEAVALIVQIHLQQNRSDLALKEVQAAKRINPLFMSTKNSLQSIALPHRFRSLDRLSQRSISVGCRWAQDSLLVNLAESWVGMRVGGEKEAEAAISAALERYPNEAGLIANSIVLNVLIGKPTEDLEKRLQLVEPSHALLADIQEKSDFFDTAAAKYSAKVSS
uniref:Coatomer subunit epsilon n=1 Tax=Emericella nidulans TaxID=162425 RepID=Q5EG52_EMEND|nr:epsilon-COP [Aspergillus nidulans]